MDWSVLLARLPPSGYRRFRNAFGRVAGVFMLLIVSPVILAIALMILMDSGGPILFRQSRAGRFARPFKIVKFRTMSTRAPESSLKVAPDNPCITRVGRFLRVSGLDELPNLWNVVHGDMALIGPRPEQFALLNYYRPWQHLRHLVKPGITGWWQIHHRDSEPMHLNVERDIYYVCNQSLALDARIMLGTLMVLFQPFRSRLARRRSVARGTVTRTTTASTAKDQGRLSTEGLDAPRSTSASSSPARPGAIGQLHYRGGYVQTSEGSPSYSHRTGQTSVDKSMSFATRNGQPHVEN